jgi:nucleoid DNA-binding protein
VQLQFNENFLFQNNLKCTTPQESKYPAVKINYTQVAKNSNIEKDLAYQAISDIFYEIQETLTNNQDIEIDLKTFGRISMVNRHITFQPNIKSKPQNMHSKQTVQSMLTMSR